MTITDFATTAEPPVEGHVLVVGAGGLGCPAAWGLRAAGVTRITLLDPDVVEISNLPRQVLFTGDDLGRSKAVTAAERLGGADAGVRGLHERLDDTNAAQHLEGVDVVIDATDGARTKDWLNHLAVHRGVPLIHAAGLQSEGRVLAVPASGTPCLACLFGRLEEETGSCADFGVWNGVVGTTGFLAAHMAVRALHGDLPRPAYVVLDFAGATGFGLAVRTNDECPVCAAPPATLEPYPEDAGCAVPEAAETAAAAGALDLREEHCPMNLLRARRALEDAAPGDVLVIELGTEGMETVPDGVRALGHAVLGEEPQAYGLRLTVRRGAREGDTPAFAGDRLRRVARQLVLPDLGEAGQQRLLEARLAIDAPDARQRDVACTYLAAAGAEIAGGGRALSLRADDAPVAVRMARAAAWADAVQRAIVAEAEPVAPIGIAADGSIR